MCVVWCVWHDGGGNSEVRVVWCVWYDGGGNSEVCESEGVSQNTIHHEHHVKKKNYLTICLTHYEISVITFHPMVHPC